MEKQEQGLRVLIVEDNPADAELLEVYLAIGGYVPRVWRVQTATEMQAALDSQEWDLILSEHMMPRFSGLQALELLKATGKDIPFILISGSAGDDVAVNAMTAGTHDFFTKSSLALLVPAIRRRLREAELRAVARAQRDAPSPPAGLRILVVDDNPDVANSFAEILTIQGHSVEIAATGTEALRLMETGEYAVVLTDMRMPDVDGPSLYRQVSARDSLLAKSFLFVTGDTFSEETHRFLTETGAVYLNKPCTFAEVESAVAQVLRRRAQ